MKNTEFTGNLIPPDMEALLDNWVSNGFKVFRHQSFTNKDVAIHRLLEGVKETHPECEPIETATVNYGIVTIAAVKCKVKEGRK